MPASVLDQAAFSGSSMALHNRFVKRDSLLKLPRQLSADAAIALHKPSFGRRPPRRCLTETSIDSFVPSSSFRDEVQHAAAETYLVTKLSFQLLSYLGVGYRWMLKLLALAMYALFLMPGFVQIGWYYFSSPYVHRSIVYGNKARNRLDLYLPANLDAAKPAVAFVTGGAWIIGYKAWGALLAKQLAERDVIVACIDYRNFPQGTISDMVEDVANGLEFFCSNIASFGGDPDRLFLIGQSAGAHLASCALIEQAKKETLDGRATLRWSSSMFKTFFGISGGYNLVELVDHFHKRGFYRSLFLSIMEGEASLPRFSPELVLKCPQGVQPWVHLLPPALLFHGTADHSIPHHATIRYADALRASGVEVTTRLFTGKTHTDLFLQDPMRGGQDALLEEVASVIYQGQKEVLLASSEGSRRLVPEFLLLLARTVSPF